jgi:hypothetical protein
MMTRKRTSSVAAAIVALLTGVAPLGSAAAQDLPSAASSASDEAYRYIDDADALLDAMGTSPPDYGFRFDGIDCWAWAMADGSTILAEPLGDDYRYYIFAPGDDYPFFVGDRTYAYGFDERMLAAVYGDNGDLVDPSGDMVDGARWLSDRGFDMKRAMQNPEPIYAGDWADSIGWFGAIELRFDSWRSRPGWIHYRNGPGRLHHRDWRTKLGTEWQKRRQRAEWFERWRRGGYRGAPQNGGKWVTTPGGERPGGKAGPGAWKGKGNWIGRPRPVAPPTPGAPGVKPDRPGRDDTGPDSRRRPPRPGPAAPGQPIPTPPAAPVTVTPLPPSVAVPPRPRSDDRGRRERLPPRLQSDRDTPSAVPLATPVPSPQSSPIFRGERRIERPALAVPRPPQVESDTGKPVDLQLPERRAISPRVEPRPLPPPAVVAPRPSFSPPRAPVSASPPPAPPPTAAAPSPSPAARPVRPAPGIRSSGGTLRGEGRGGPSGKGKER